MARRRRRQVEFVLAEHARIIASLTAFESTLSGPCTGGEAAWRRRLHDELRPLIRSLGRHNARAEGPDGRLWRDRSRHRARKRVDNGATLARVHASAGAGTGSSARGGRRRPERR